MNKNTRPPLDLPQRQRVLDPAESFIIQAPAGSGKTELLIQRFLRLLAGVREPEEIIAVTFTRKAAAEMRGRIMSALDAAMHARPAPGTAAETTQLLAARAMARDRQQDWQLPANPGRLRIQTIDALGASLTRQLPVLSGFGAQPETVEKAGQLYQLAAANTLAELDSGAHWSSAIAVLLQHLDNDLPRLRDMLAAMLGRRDQWLRHIPAQHPRRQLEAALAHLVESVLSAARHALPENYVMELLALLRFAAANLHAQGADSILCSCLDIDSLPGDTVADLDSWRALVSLLFTQSGSWRKAANVKLGFPAACANKAESDRRKAMKQRFAALIANLSAETGLLETLLEIKYLPAPRYSESEWEVVQALYHLLVLADAQLRLLFAERNQMDFSGITQAAIKALGGEDAPTDLALQLDYQISHILVDEFQDISVNQYILLEKMTAGWSVGDGHSLFLVGDPMQSIYRFREAEVGLFLQTWQQQRFNQLALTPVNITVNFRSDPGIVTWVNRTFKQVLPARGDAARGAVNYVDADIYLPPGANHAVHFQPGLGRDDSREAGQIVAIIRQARDSKSGESIAILVRNRTHLGAIIRRLRAADLPYRAVEIEALGQRAAIRDLLALTLAMTHFADRVAWLALLRAPWCGLSLSDLHLLAGDNAHKSDRESIWECMLDPVRIGSLSAGGQHRLTQLTQVLAAAFREKGRRRLSRWIESVWLKIGGPACLQNANDLENSLTFFQLLDEFDVGADLQDREAFMEEVTSLYAAAEMAGEDAVQIMTIHKAKGLEFDRVILPGLARTGASDEARLLLWMERPHAGRQDLLLAPVREAGTAGSPIYDYLRRLERVKQEYELGRLLYVAATRAKQHLYLFAAVEVSDKKPVPAIVPPRRNSLLAQLWPLVEQDFDQALQSWQPKPATDNTAEALPLLPLRRLTQGWVLPSPPDPVDWLSPAVDTPAALETESIEFVWAGETIKHTGSVVHRCIQWIAEDGIENWNAQRIRASQHFHRLLLRRLGVSEKEMDQAVGQVQRALINLLEDERGQWLFSGEQREARNEYALSGLYQGKLVHIVIDRTFVDTDGIRWIVDYKTSRHEGTDVAAFLDRQQARYRGQLEKYAALVRALADNPVRLGLYFPLLKGWREWEL